MNFSPDLLKAADHCQHRSFITNRYTGARIAVDCGQCDYCIHKRAQKASMRVKTAGSAFKHSYFVTLTYDNEHIPLMNCKVLHSEYEDVVGISGDIHFGDEYHNYIPVSEYQCDDNFALRHIFFEQVQGTVPYDREIKEWCSIALIGNVTPKRQRYIRHKSPCHCCNTLSAYSPTPAMLPLTRAPEAVQRFLLQKNLGGAHTDLKSKRTFSRRHKKRF